ncbi:hypothetical protein UY3_08852 [Chelonia mydas]|uniref:Uncharacterized protein n=1 Tax=Chelonia mydas TaxID=8469 RepID=M7B7Q8_CHEMY|nr:hypothetical protein UY3_08852 [Chelonia mydas]
MGLSGSPTPAATLAQLYRPQPGPFTQLHLLSPRSLRIVSKESVFYRFLGAISRTITKIEPDPTLTEVNENFAIDFFGQEWIHKSIKDIGPNPIALIPTALTGRFACVKSEGQVITLGWAFRKGRKWPKVALLVQKVTNFQLCVVLKTDQKVKLKGPSATFETSPSKGMWSLPSFQRDVWTVLSGLDIPTQSVFYTSLAQYAMAQDNKGLSP